MTPRFAVAVALLLHAGAPGAAAQAAPQAAAQRDFSAPPPGASTQDRALWKRARYVNNQILIERGLSTRLQARARGNGYVEQLDALARQGKLPAKAAEDLSHRIYAKWGESAKLLTRQWPVDPTRSCRAPLLVFEGVLYRDESPGKTAQLEDARRILEACVDRGEVPLQALSKLNAELDALLSEAERTVADARARTPEPVPAAASTPSAAVSATQAEPAAPQDR